MLDGRRCAKEKFSLLGKRKIDVLLWNSQDQDIAPAKMQMSVERMKLVVRFHEVRPARLTSSQFQIPSGYTKYTQFDDLVQSLLWDGIKSGLTSRASK